MQRHPYGTKKKSAGLETVWLKEAPSRLKIDKRTLSDNIDLPDELTFHLRRGSNGITLHLKRNRDIDPNADVYFIRTRKDGQSVLVKTQNLENEVSFQRIITKLSVCMFVSVAIILELHELTQ
ncbi:hypothetical protein CHS0354_001065 [Potamilus streckersoni]|uniref:Uncharacterized protein n=1 Tax=Potamilus streckersoni TaxID=2493646 RepID=A0AAE0W211_9BIVA|nr:hypothetical protein CHS0354_001065 [Potamilus streckersoni]